MSPTPNLVQLFTIDGPIHIDTRQLNGPRNLLTIYTESGERLKEVGETETLREAASYGVHRDNLFATHQLAVAAYEAAVAALAAV